MEYIAIYAVVKKARAVNGFLQTNNSGIFQYLMPLLTYRYDFSQITFTVSKAKQGLCLQYKSECPFLMQLIITINRILKL